MYQGRYGAKVQRTHINGIVPVLGASHAQKAFGRFDDAESAAAGEDEPVDVGDQVAGPAVLNVSDVIMLSCCGLAVVWQRRTVAWTTARVRTDPRAVSTVM